MDGNDDRMNQAAFAAGTLWLRWDTVVRRRTGRRARARPISSCRHRGRAATVGVDDEPGYLAANQQNTRIHQSV